MGPDPTGSNAQLWAWDEFVSLLACSEIPGELHLQWTQNYEGSGEWVTVLGVLTTMTDLQWPFQGRRGGAPHAQAPAPCRRAAVIPVDP